jgi:hypothetical protein
VTKGGEFLGQILKEDYTPPSQTGCCRMAQNLH